MSYVGDYFAISNSYDINSLQNMQGLQFKLAELRERADAIGRNTGILPLGFFAFDKTHPTPREKNKAAKWVTGALFGLAGAFFGMATHENTGRNTVIGGAIGGAIGFVFGLFGQEAEETRMQRAMTKYDGYLTQLEIEANKSSIMGFAGQQPVISHHAEKLMSAREAALLDQPIGKA
jgi:hypothetical protein